MLRRQFFTRVLLGAAATVPVLLIGRGAGSTNVWGTDQDRLSVDFVDLLRSFHGSTVRTSHSVADIVGTMRLENVKLPLNADT